MPSLTTSILILFLHVYFGYKKNRRTNGEERGKKGHGAKTKGRINKGERKQAVWEPLYISRYTFAHE